MLLVDGSARVVVASFVRSQRSRSFVARSRAEGREGATTEIARSRP